MKNVTTWYVNVTLPITSTSRLKQAPIPSRVITPTTFQVSDLAKATRQVSIYPLLSVVTKGLSQRGLGEVETVRTVLVHL